MQRYLKRTDTVDHDDAAVNALARSLSSDDSAVLTAERCFIWVRDRIRHSSDSGDTVVTSSASEVLRHGTGMCYAKSHLLAALLRANGLPCGFVYQRLATDDSATRFCLHGLCAVWLEPQGWYRLDPRGNREGVSAAFDPPHERLAFETTADGEYLIDEIYEDPLSVVLEALARFQDVTDLCKNLPDRTVCDPPRP